MQHIRLRCAASLPIDLAAADRASHRHPPFLSLFCSKYPTRDPEEWRLKSQKYKPPGTAQTSLVLLEDLVMGLHAVWQQHEGCQQEGSTAAPAAAAVAPAAAAAVPAVATPTVAPAAASPASLPAPAASGDAASAVQDRGAAAAELASCGSSSMQPQPAAQPAE